MLTGLTSCTSYLDKSPSSSVDPEVSWKTFADFQGFTDQLYLCLPSVCNRDDNNFFNNGEEEVWGVNAKSQGAWVWSVDQGDFWAWQTGGYGSGGSFMDSNPSNKAFDITNVSTAYGALDAKRTKAMWPGCWYGIRQCNLGLQNLSKMTGTDQEKNTIAGQLYFFRAMFHFHLITYFGGLPYINTVLPADKKLTLPRLSYQACADSIAKDFQKAIDLLPTNWDDPSFLPGVLTQTKNDLRINKWVAIAYSGKNYLYAGSPLMNSASGGADDYNQAYLKKAADAFGTLLSAVETGTCPYKLIPWSKYSENYDTNGQSNRMPGSATVNGVVYTEAIYRVPYLGGTGQSMDKEYLAAGVLQDRSWSQYPSANYVNYFGMANGMPINDVNKADVDDPTSGYDTHYPWKNRDPRFYLNIAYDTKKMVISSSSGAKNYVYANLYYPGGNYRQDSKGYSSGYLLLKFDPVGFNKYDNYYNSHVVHVPYMRLADVYLMYSEAIAKGYNDIHATSTTLSKDAVWAINKVRNRVILPDGTPLPGVAAKYLVYVESFMSELRRERAVELAWEGHRFNDLRRWHLLTKYPYNIKTGISFTRDIPETNDAAPTFNFLDKNVPENNKINNLKEFTIITRNFQDKHYWLPLKQVDTNMYLEFNQNPGW